MTRSIAPQSLPHQAGLLQEGKHRGKTCVASHGHIGKETSLLMGVMVNTLNL